MENELFKAISDANTKFCLLHLDMLTNPEKYPVEQQNMIYGSYRAVREVYQTIEAILFPAE